MNSELPPPWLLLLLLLLTLFSNYNVTRVKPLSQVHNYNKTKLET